MDSIFRQGTTESSMDFEDDGDYATLRMGAANMLNREDTVSEENKVSIYNLLYALYGFVKIYFSSHHRTSLAITRMMFR